MFNIILNLCFDSSTQKRGKGEVITKDYSAYMIEAIDGDTIRVMRQLDLDIFRKEKHRLTHIDTPEKKAGADYEAAKAFTAQFSGQSVRLVTRGKTYDRKLSDVYVTYQGKEENLSSLLLEKGLAVPYLGG